MKKVNIKKLIYISIFWIIISIQFIIGSNLQNKGYSINSISELFLSLLKIILLSCTFTALHYFILEFLKKHKKQNVEDKNKNYKINKYNGIIYFIIIIIAWIPTLLAFFPTIQNYDGVYQIQQCYYNIISAFHPILHTMIISICYMLGKTYLQSTTIGLLLYSILQMTVMALIFSYSVKFIEEKTNKKWLRNISLAFFAVFPIIPLFSIMTTKDVMFAGFMLLFVVNLYKIYEEKNQLSDYIFFIIISTLMVLFRNNAIYAVLGLIPFIILILRENKKAIKVSAILIILTILSYKLLYIWLMNINDATLGSIKEKMSVFSQAVAKVCNEKEEELTEEEKNIISYFFSDYKRLGKVYLPNISDNTKNLIRCDNVELHQKEFYKLIIQLGKKYPRIYVDSFLNTIRGYWYINDTSFSIIKQDQFPDTFGYFELPFYENENEQECIVKGYSFIPELKEFDRYMFCKNNYRKIPILYILFQPATYFYMVIAYLLYSLYKKKKINLIVGMFLLLYFATCFLGPVALVRYIYGVILSAPILLSSIVKDKKEEENEK